jgi:hypothetical protein
VKWQTRITGGAASRAIGWMELLAAHPALADALAGAVDPDAVEEAWR